MDFRSLLFFTLYLLSLVLAEDPVVKVSGGQLLGARHISRDGKPFLGFKGIPYGEVVERFQAAVPASAWNDTRNATEYGPSCPQYDCYKNSTYGEEDCLSLSVFTPKLPTPKMKTELFPVLVIFHLGYHSFGSGGMYDPSYLMDSDVIVVNFNYRIGPFGFLNTGDKNSAGNQGLRDQILVLEWVRNNIHHFSGDWERVTAVGASSGGTDVLLHLVSPQSRGLFQRAVVMSGTLSSCSFVRDPEVQARKMAEQIGCPANKTMDELVDCLKKMDPLDILNKQKMPTGDFEDMDMDEYAFFGPSVETYGSDRIITDHPFKLISDGKANADVPLIIGSLEQDGLNPFTAMFLNDTALFERLLMNWTNKAPLLYGFTRTAQDPAKLATKLRDFYAEDGNLTGSDVIQIFTDRHFAFYTDAVAKSLAKAGSEVFFYHFNHTPEITVASQIGYSNVPKGPGHNDELQYIFNMTQSFQVPAITDKSTPAEYLLSKIMVTLWESFADSGKPKSIDGLGGKEWQQYNPSEPFQYDLGLVSKMVPETEAYNKRMEFWDGLYKTDLALEMS